MDGLDKLVDHGANTVWTKYAIRWTFADTVESWIKGDKLIRIAYF